MDCAVILDQALTHHRGGRPDLAEPLYRKLVEANPDHADALHLLGVIALQRNELDDAEAWLLRATTADASNPKFYNSLGFLLHRRHRPAEAERAFAKAASLDPNLAAAWFNLGNIQRDGGRLAEAVANYERTLALDPANAGLHNNLGVTLMEMRNFEGAREHYHQAAELDPTFIEPRRNLGILYKERGMADEAHRAFAELIKLKPEAGARINQATILPAIVQSWDHIREIRRRFEDNVDALLDETLSLTDPLREIGLGAFYLAYHGCDDRALQIKLATLYTNACPSLSAEAPHCARWAPGARIKVGFISRFFHDHTMGKLYRGFIAKLPRRTFAVTAFLLPHAEDPVRRFIRGHADHTVDLPLDLEAARQAIADCKLDILFYTDIGMEPFTYYLAFARLAPVQCTTWGHPLTTGIPSMDYFISSKDMEPHGGIADHHYSEHLIRLRRVTTHYYRPSPPPPRDRGYFGLAENTHIHVCPQSLFKFHPDFDLLMGGILDRDPQAVIVLLGGDTTLVEPLKARFRRTLGHEAMRVHILKPMPLPDFLALVALADVMIDPAPFGGGNTTLEALAVGTPVVTLPGDFLRGRLTYAMYRQMEMMDCVAANPADYVAKAVALGSDRSWRREVQARIFATRDVLYEDRDIVDELADFFVEVVESRGR